MSANLYAASSNAKPEIKGIEVKLYAPQEIRKILGGLDYLVVTDNVTHFAHPRRRITHLFDFIINRAMKGRIRQMGEPNWILDLDTNPQLLKQYFEDYNKLDLMTLLLKYREYVMYPPGAKEALEKIASERQQSQMRQLYLFPDMEQ